jgi:hypothetical protein
MTHTGEHVYRLTAWRWVALAAVIVALLSVPSALLFAALHAHGPAPPAPTPVVVVNA